MTILIAAGGTGGHIFPALSVAQELKDSSSYPIVWVGAFKSLEQTIIPKYDFPIELVSIKGLRGKGLKRLFSLPVILINSLYQSYKIIKRIRPRVIVGFGGYVTFPIALMGWLLKVPVLIHEQNSIAGLSNKILAKIAAHVLVSYPKVLTSSKTTLVGNPVRAEITNLLPLKERYESRQGGLNILVLGGSLGAKTFNQVLPHAFTFIKDKVNSITHQVGRGDALMVKKLYESLNVTQVEVLNFIDNIDVEYAKADLIICRSGASTLSEVCSCGVATILVPFPYAVDDHQKHNALYLVEHNAAYMVLEGEKFIDEITAILQHIDRFKCVELATQARLLARPNATQEISKIIQNYIN